MKPWWKIVCLSFILFTSVPAFAQEITIGCYIPMTGSAAAMGQVAWKGIEIAQRLKPEVLGKKVRLVLVDTKSDKIEAANAVSRLIEKDKAAAIIGEVISGDTLAGAPIAERFAVPNITPTATNPLVTQNRQYAFRACFVDTLQGKVAARFAKENLKAQKAAVIIDQAQDYCVGLANFFMQEFKQRGGQIVATTYIQTGDQDFSAQISAIKPLAPDIIYAPNYYAEDALLARQMRELGLNVPVLTGDGAQVSDLIKIGGPAVDGMYLTAHFHRESVNAPLAQEFIKTYEAETKREVDAFAALGGDCYLLLLNALERAQTVEGPKLRQALAQTKDFSGVSGSITMGPDNNPIKEVNILQVQGGKFVFVAKMAP
jgi:branched-chain amino acid transport system substrate-binding protein